MLWIYNIGIAIYGLLLRAVALFNPKAKLFVDGRKHQFQKIKAQLQGGGRPVWFHFASLGEFEQGRPVLEQIKQAFPDQNIVVTFFSPSGYEVRKNYALASVFYLPLDTKSNAEQLIQLFNPKLAVFTKYEFWHHYFHVLKKKNIPLYLISGIFRPNQLFFKWYGKFYRNMLSAITYFFVQDMASIELLQKIGFNNTSLAGDTRFDRVFEHAKMAKRLPKVENFCGTYPTMIAGSTWLPDERILKSLVEHNPNWKFIIAPHEIGEAHIAEIEKLFPLAVRFSNLTDQTSTAQVLIIDNIGMLSSLYQYGKVAYIGGGFGVGIHNTLEAVAFGLPVIFGPNYHKFREAKDLVEIGVAKSINSAEELNLAFETFKVNAQLPIMARNYIAEKKGATDLIMQRLNLHLNP